MPELPEVETIKRTLSMSVVGSTIEHVNLRREGLRTPFTPGIAENVTHRIISSIHRIGKYLVFDIDNGSHLISHLGMSGKFRLEDIARCDTGAEQASQLLRHDHVVMRLSNNKNLVLNDARRFGIFEWVPDTHALESHRSLKSLGPDPLDPNFGHEQLAQGLSKTRTPIKLALLDQRIIAGIGNIYACEALHRARISPHMPANLCAQDVRDINGAGSAVLRLHDALSTTLLAAIQAGGSTLRDYATPSNRTGYFQHQFRVYGSVGKACVECGSEIILERMGGRSTFYCSQCQAWEI